MGLSNKLKTRENQVETVRLSATAGRSVAFTIKDYRTLSQGRQLTTLLTNTNKG